MSKRFIIKRVAFLILCSLPYLLQGQAPALINYQAIARNTQTGTELSNQQIFMQAMVRSGGPSGAVLYQESHEDVPTNEFGLFSLQIGGGEPLVGSLADLNWAGGNYWLEIELDAGSGLQSVGSMQLVSVPYAMHANTVTNADDADADPTNELVEDFSFDQELSILSLEDAGGLHQVDLSSLIDDADSDPNNERITGIFYGASSNTLTITEGGFNYSTGLGPVDLDIDPTNELIDENGLVLSDDNILQISEAGIVHSVDLTPLTEGLAWTYLPEEGMLYNTDSKVGVGTEVPNAKLDIQGQGANNERLLAVAKGPDQPVLEVVGDEVQLSPTSTLDMGGRVLNVVRNVSSPTADAEIPLEPNDRYIIVNSGQNFKLIMPPGIDNPGRRLTVHRTGTPPLQFFKVQLQFSDQLDFNPENNTYIMEGFFTETEEFLSVGEGGWIRLR